MRKRKEKFKPFSVTGHKIEGKSPKERKEGKKERKVQIKNARINLAIQHL